MVEQLKKLDNNGNATGAGNDQFVLTVFEKINETKLKFSQECVTVLWKMPTYEEGRVKLTKTQLNKLKTATKNKAAATFKITKKNF